MPVGLDSSADAASETGPNMKFAHVCKPAYVRIREKTVGGVAIWKKKFDGIDTQDRLYLWIGDATKPRKQPTYYYGI